MRLIFFFASILLCYPCRPVHAFRLPERLDPIPQSSLQSYTGIWDMPTARVMPDWHMRVKAGHSYPYSYYGVALGFWDRLEFHGQFTRVSTITAFPGYGYGAYKDRAAGARLVLLKESDSWPQVAVGAFDATGTALFGQRYIVASKMLGPFDFTLGLGQGVLAGEFVRGGSNSDPGLNFLFSSPWRRTGFFGGVEWRITPRLELSAEYSSLDYGKMFGFVDSQGERIKEDDSRTNINIGLKYRVASYLNTHLAYMRGRELSWSLNFDLPLDPQGILGWERKKAYRAMEKSRWKAYESGNDELARMVVREIKGDGFSEVAAACSDHSLWIEAENTIYLSPARALGRMASIADQLCPSRIDTFYLNLKRHGQIIDSLRCSRADLRSFLESRMDEDGFFRFAELDLYPRRHWREFSREAGAGGLQEGSDNWYSWELMPRVRTFLNNRAGFFKHKVVLQPRLNLYPWSGALIAGEAEFTLYNQYDEVIYAPLERDAVRTDLTLYERRSDPRISVLAFDQLFEMPWNIQFRAAAGMFESAYAGLGVEAFRYLADGLLGIGFESEVVKKRALGDNFRLRSDVDTTFYTCFLNTYAQLWPDQGLEAGLKIGRFLAGDVGARIDIRRSFKYFTIGAWYTRTDTSIFSSPKNKNATEKGVYIRIPFSIFSKHERRGHFVYGITSFTKDQGQTVRQPRRLYPMDPWDSPYYTRKHFDDMRGM